MPENLSTVGVDITVPKGWVVLDLTHETVDQLIHNAEQQHSKADSSAARFIKSQASTLGKNLLLFACRQRGDTCRDNVAIIGLPGSPRSFIGDEEDVKQQYAAHTGARDVTVSDTVVDGDATVQVLGQAPVTTGTSRTPHLTGYLVPGSKEAVEIDFVTSGDGRKDPDVQSMVRSIKLRPLDMAARILPTPGGSEISKSSDTHTGPLPPALLDSDVGPGTSAQYGYKDGQEATFDANDTSERIDTSILEFSSAAQAQAFVPVALDYESSPDEHQVQHPFAPIAGGLALDPANAETDGFYDYAVVAVMGRRLMMLNYSNDHPSGISDAVAGLIVEQYNRLR
jgi:hypothetical protein